MSFDERMAGLAARAAEAHATSDGFATDTLKARVRRGRRVRTTVTTVGTVAALALVGVVGVAVADGWGTTPPAGTTSPEPVPTETATATTPPTPAETVPVLEGWTDAGVDPGVFGDMVITAAVQLGGRVVAVGCDNGSAAWSPSFPAWVAEEPGAWVPATGTGPACFQDAVATPHGVYAAAFPDLYRSVDGYTWSKVPGTLPSDAWGVTAVFAAGDRVTVLVQQATEGESRTAGLVTSTDGETWQAIDDTRARVFDDADVAAAVTRPDGSLLAVGASPGGQFVPTAAMWLSDDGLSWSLVSPVGDGFADCFATDVTAVPGGYAAVGSCAGGDARALAIWSSADGAVWSAPVLAPDEAADAAGSVIDAAVARVGDVTYVVGSRIGERDPAGPQLRAVWRTNADGVWVAVPADDVVPVPFRLVDLGGRQVGFWYPLLSSGDGRVRVLVADESTDGS